MLLCCKKVGGGCLLMMYPQKKGQFKQREANQRRGRDHKTLERVAEQLVSSWFQSEAVRPSQQFQHTVRLLP